MSVKKRTKSVMNSLVNNKENVNLYALCEYLLGLRDSYFLTVKGKPLEVFADV